MVNTAILCRRARSLVAALALSFLLWLTYRALSAAYADELFRQGTVASVRRAAAWEPANAYYYSWLASLQEFAGQDASRSLLTAVELNPFDSSSLIRLAAVAETRRDKASAEQYLLRAAAINRQFEPRWALMNFYFRQDAHERFWLWTRKALALSYGDLTPVFDLCWKMTGDAEVIRQAIPTRRAILAKYLSYLMTTGHLPAADAIAQELSQYAEDGDRPVLLSFCDRSNSSGHVEAALHVWNTLCQRKLLPFQTLRPRDGVSLTNANLVMPFSSGGYDWQPATAPEVEVAAIRNGVTFILSGSQPEDFDLVEQYLPILTHRRYQLHFQYRFGTASMRGISWIVSAPKQHEASYTQLAGNSEEWHDGDFEFGPFDVPLCRLALNAVRMRGSTRPEGSLSVRNLRLELMP